MYAAMMMIRNTRCLQCAPVRRGGLRVAGFVLVAAALAAAPAAHAQGNTKPSPKAAAAQASAAPAAAMTTSAPNALQGFSQNRNQPIHIDAAKLEVRDKDKIATFSGDAKTGDVKVVQGDTVMRSKVLVVYYDQDGGSAGTKTAQAATPGPGGSQQIRRLEAKGNVIVTQKDQTVTGDNGVFDVKVNTVTMTGGVVLTQGENVLRGESLVVDLTTGVSRIEPGKSGRVQSVFIPKNNNQQPAAQPPR